MSLSFNGNTEFKPKFSRWLQTGKVSGGRTPHMKVVGMLVVSLRGVNFGFWSHLGCTGQNAIIFSREGLHAKKYENIYLICIFLMGHSYNPSFLMCLCFNMVSFRGKKKLGPRPDRSPLGLKFKFPTSIPTPFICGVPPPPGANLYIERKPFI